MAKVDWTAQTDISAAIYGRDANSLGIGRMIDGHMTGESNSPALVSRAG
ncbi:MAG: hypothetical protein WA637_18765 [Terriglobales bacterium]